MFRAEVPEGLSVKSPLATTMVEEKRKVYEHQKKQVEIDRLNEFMRPLTLLPEREVYHIVR